MPEAREMMRLGIMSLVALGLASCVSFDGPPTLVRIAQGKFGGEALFRGRMEVRGGCVVTAGARPATVLFDPDVILVEHGTAIRDGAGSATVRFGEPVRAGMAHLREKGKGWPIRDIEEFYGVEIPENCPRDEVVRLHDFKSIE